MIEVFPRGNGFTWTMVDGAGRVLVRTDDNWPTDAEAFKAAREYRTTFWAMACQVDHRMGACL